MRRVLLTALAVALLLCACAGQGRGADAPMCRLVLEEGAGFRAEKPACAVPRGADAVFMLTPEAGYAFAGVDYPDYTLTSAGGRQTLTLHNVRYSSALTVTYRPNARMIRYHGNGGYTARGARMEQRPAAFTHLRSNTAQGSGLFEREGHTLYGWNTAPDGSGTAVGLGSRTAVPRDVLELYAMWAPWSDASDFTTAPNKTGVTITGYLGDDDTLCVPAELDGRPVTEIAPRAFAGLGSRTVILPAGLKRICADAFRGAALRELYLSDDVAALDPSAFSGCSGLATLHINAAVPPRYATYFAAFADKYDRLLSLAGRRKLVLFSGSSARFGYDSGAIDAAFPDYEVVNMGVFAYTAARPQLELILSCMGGGDVLLHAPEFDAARHQFCASSDLDIPFFCMMEANYDALAALDLRGYTNVFPALSGYLEQRRDLPLGDYSLSPGGFDEDGRAVAVPSYNEYGDYILHRPNAPTPDPVYGAPVPYTVDAFPEDTYIAPLNAVYDRFAQKGVRVFFTYAPRNALALSSGSTPEARAQLDAYFRRVLHAPVISPLEESLYSGIYLSGTDNHLSTEGVSIRTRRIIRDLKAAMADAGGGGADG